MLNVDALPFAHRQLINARKASSSSFFSSSSTSSIDSPDTSATNSPTRRGAVGNARRRIRAVLACALHTSIGCDPEVVVTRVYPPFAELCAAMCVFAGMDSSAATLGALSSDGLYLTMLDRKGKIAQRVKLPGPMSDFAASLASPLNVPCNVMTVSPTSSYYLTAGGSAAQIVLVCSRPNDVAAIQKYLLNARSAAALSRQHQQLIDQKKKKAQQLASAGTIGESGVLFSGALSGGQRQAALPEKKRDLMEAEGLFSVSGGAGLGYLKILKSSSNGLRLGFDRSQFSTELDKLIPVTDSFASILAPPPSVEGCTSWSASTTSHNFLIFTMKQSGVLVVVDMFLLKVLRIVALPRGLKPVSMSYELVTNVQYDPVAATSQVENEASETILVVAAASNTGFSTSERDCLLRVHIRTGKMEYVSGVGPYSLCPFTAVPSTSTDSSSSQQRFALGTSAFPALVLCKNSRQLADIEPAFDTDFSHQLSLGGAPSSLQLLHNGYLAVSFLSSDEIFIVDLDENRRRVRMRSEGHRSRYGAIDEHGWLALKLNLPSPTKRLGLTLLAEGSNDKRVKNSAWLDL